MPGSQVHGKANIVEWFANRDDIKTIVDVGCGSATYAKLLGDKYIWTGIDIWGPYIELFELQKYYKEIIIADIFHIYKTLEPADCIIFGDVLEHLNKNNAVDVLIGSLNKFNHVVLSIPIKGQPSAIHYNNPFEQHKSEWTFNEIKNFTDWEVAIESGDIGIFIK
jgi:SAM-dependent methyltransferase